MRREDVDLKDHTTAARRIIHHVLQRCVGKESSVPILFAVDLDRGKAGRQRAAGHDVLGTDRDLRAVEIGKVAGQHVDRTDAQPHVPRVVDPVEIDQPLQRPLERGGLVVADPFVE